MNVCIEGVSGCLESVIDFWGDQHLHGDGGSAAVAGEQCEGGGEPAARAFTADGDAVWVDADRVAVLVDPGQRCVAVFQSCGERVFGGESVVHGDDDGVDLGGDP